MHRSLNKCSRCDLIVPGWSALHCEMYKKAPTMLLLIKIHNVETHLWLIWIIISINDKIAHDYQTIMIFVMNENKDNWYIQNNVLKYTSVPHREWNLAGNEFVLPHHIPDSNVHGANMGPGGPHCGPMNFIIWDTMRVLTCDFPQEPVFPQVWFIVWRGVTTAQHSVALVSVLLWLCEASGHNVAAWLYKLWMCSFCRTCHKAKINCPL